MLTAGDDYPVHQTADPIASSGTDRNFYDRYFFNGYAKDGSVFFACALGVYPNINVMDASFCVVANGKQYNLRGSRALNSERMKTTVGPITIEVVEPLQALRVKVDSAEHGVQANLLFTARTVPMEEPRFTRRNGPRTFMDYTRLTQNGLWAGEITVESTTHTFAPATHWGTRDRSWGIRPVGVQDPQPQVPPIEPQFHWLWAPLNFDDCYTLFHINADGAGEPWNTNGVIAPLEGNSQEFPTAYVDVDLMEGTRHAGRATITYPHEDGTKTQIELTRKWDFSMSGLGYTHPEWGHGHYKGELAVGFDTMDMDKDLNDMLNLHVQTFVSAIMTLPDGTQKQGSGVFEQLVIGAYEPWGLKGLIGPA